MAAAALVALTVALGAGHRRNVAPAPGPAAVSTDVPAPQPAQPARRAGSAGAAEPPVSTRLPSGREVAVHAVSTRTNGILDVPTDIGTAGWWRGGARLGDPFGSMLMAAHVDSSTQGLGPYAELLSVRPGQRVRVVSRHLDQTFAVRSLRLVPQGSLAGRDWLYSPAGPSRLTLVTCAPPYDAGNGGYQNLAVVTAYPLSEPRVRDRG